MPPKSPVVPAINRVVSEPLKTEAPAMPKINGKRNTTILLNAKRQPLSPEPGLLLRRSRQSLIGQAEQLSSRVCWFSVITVNVLSRSTTLSDHKNCLNPKVLIYPFRFCIQANLEDFTKVSEPKRFRFGINVLSQNICVKTLKLD